MKNKKLIRLTEADLHRMVRNSVNRVLNEMGPNLSYHLGRAAARRERVGDIDYAMQMRKHYRDSVLPDLQKDYNVSGYFDNSMLSDDPFTQGYLDQKDFMGHVDNYVHYTNVRNKSDADDAFFDLTKAQEDISANSQEWRERKSVKDKMRKQMNKYRFDNFNKNK